jgi:hypothetical protein
MRDPMEKLRERVLDRISPEPNTGCWLWVGKMVPNGYGTVNVGYKRMMAHRLSYTLFKGEIPTGMEIDHKCRQKACVNPDHLEPVSRSENMIRNWPFDGRNKPTCVRGHLLDGISSNGKQLRRHCVTCKRVRALAYWHGRRKSKNRPQLEEYRGLEAGPSTGRQP